MHAIVHAADVQDRDGGALLMASLFGAFPFLIKLYADGGYQGPEFQSAINRILAASTSRSSSDRVKPQASSRCPNAGSSNAHSLGSAAADDWPRTGNASTTRRSPSSASPPSVSCCENYAIPHDVLGQTLKECRGNFTSGTNKRPRHKEARACSRECRSAAQPRFLRQKPALLA